MSASKQIKKQYRKRERNSIYLLRKPPQEYTSEDYHKLRVEIKKLRALFNLVSFCLKNFKRKKYFKPFKIIFKQAGKVRQLQLEQILLKKYSLSYSLKNYIAQLKKTQLEERNIFFSICDKNVADIKKKHKKIISRINKIHKKRINQYMENSRQKIEEELNKKQLKEEQVHKLRKQLKEFYYNRKSLNFENDHLLKQSDAFQELLGKWHDYQSTDDHLKKIINSHQLKSTQLKHLKKTEPKISVTKKQLLKKINASKHDVTF